MEKQKDMVVRFKEECREARGSWCFTERGENIANRRSSGIGGSHCQES